MNNQQRHQLQNAAFDAKHGRAKTADVDSIQDAIAKLRPGDKAHWTTDGKPNANVLSEMLGRAVSAAERDKAWKAAGGA